CRLDARRAAADRGPRLPDPQEPPARRPSPTGELARVTVAIVTDSTADLPTQLSKSRSITVVPLTLNFEGRSLLDGVDIRPSEFYRKLPHATTHPTTSQPSAGQFAEAYSRLPGEHAACCSIPTPRPRRGGVNPHLGKVERNLCVRRAGCRDDRLETRARRRLRARLDVA